MKETLLIVDDEKQICLSLKGILEDEGYKVIYALSPEKARELLCEHNLSLILLDVWFGKDSWDGVHFLDSLRQLYPVLPIIMISGHGTFEMTVRAIKKGAYDFIEKPFEIDRLLLSIKRALRSTKEQMFSLSHKETDDGGLVLEGNSCAIKNLKAQVSRLISTRARVLLKGEVGSGAEEIAHYIHAHSSDKTEKFLIMDSETLEEKKEMFFGKEKNDTIQEISLLEKIQCGTLVLNHIERLPKFLQKEILGLSENARFKRIGGEKYIPFKGRLMAITSCDLEEKCKNDKFRIDLYHRLSVNKVEIPTLKERKEDIPFLLVRLVKQMAAEHRAIEKRFSLSASKALCSYDWPGNLKELKNVVERLFILFPQEEEVHFSSLPLEIQNVLSALKNDSDVLLGLSLIDARAVFEYQYLRAHLSSCDGNISKVAKCIGIERSALYRKLKTLEDRVNVLSLK